MNPQKDTEIVSLLKKEILNGKYSATGSSFPSIRGLARRFGVTRSVIVRVVQTLRAKGLLVSHQGKGTFLTRAAKLSSGSIGLIVPGNCYAEIFPPICHEIARLAQARGLTLVLGDVTSARPEDRARQVKAIARKFAAEHMAGVVYQPTELVEDIERLNQEVLSVLKEAGVPVVIIDWDVVPSPKRSRYDLVAIDNYDAGRALGQHLVASGARQIRFLLCPNSAFSIGKRVLGVKSCVNDPDRVEVEIDVSDAAQVARLLKRRPRPDALVCGNDTMAARLLVTLRKLGVKVPDEILVAGFDDVQHASLVVPPLTTVHQPCADIARKAFEMLLSRMANPQMPVCACLLPAPLVVRESTTRRRAEDARTKRKGKE